MKILKLADNEKPIDDYLSKKLSIISFFSALAVVLIHSWNWGFSDNESGIIYTIEYFLSQAFCRSAVPFFFACSGFLLCAGFSNAGVPEIFVKLKKRIRSILIPWLLWVIIGIIFEYVWFLFLSAWTNAPVRCSWLESPHPLWTILKDYFWGDHIIHLWFLKRLMLFFIFSPIFIFLIRKSSFFFFLCIFLLAFSFRSTYFNDDLCCFIFGMTIALKGFDIKRKAPWYVGCALFAIWIVLCCFHTGAFRFIYMRNLFGVISVWTLYDVMYPVVKKIEKKLLELTAFSFFVYCLHPFPQTVLDTIARPKIPLEYVRYFAIWISTVTICLIIAFAMRRFIKPVYRILSGGR